MKTVLFVPYALRDMDKYAETAHKKFTSWGELMMNVGALIDMWFHPFKLITLLNHQLIEFVVSFAVYKDLCEVSR